MVNDSFLNALLSDERRRIDAARAEDTAREQRKARSQPQDSGPGQPGGLEFGLNVPPQVLTGIRTPILPLPIPGGPAIKPLTQFLGGALAGAVGGMIAGEALDPSRPSAGDIATTVGTAIGKTVGGALLPTKPTVPALPFGPMPPPPPPPALPPPTPPTPTGVPAMPAPGTGQPVPIGQLTVGSPAPALGTIVKVWDTWPGAGVTGGGRAPIFYRTIDGKTFVRKLDGTIKRVPKTRNIVLNSRNLNLRNYIRIEKAMEKITGRIARASKRLKRG